MNDSIIVCPTCKADIKLNESLAGPLVEQARRDFETRFATREAELNSRLKADRAAIAAEEAAKIKASVTEVYDRQQAELDQTRLRLNEQEAKLAEAQQAQAELLIKGRELEDAKRGMELKIEQRIQDSLVTEREKIRAEADSQLGAKIHNYEQKIAETEAALKSGQETLERERLAIATRIDSERQRIANEEAVKNRLALEDQARQVASLESILKEREVKLAEAQQAQAELLRKQRELDDQKRQMELTIETRVSESIGTVRETARQELETGFQLKVAEREQTILGLKRQIEELGKRADPGSSQTRGAVQEGHLETTLKARFHEDSIERVSTGVLGADVLQRVFTPGRKIAGTILWESKRTLHWSEGWLAKLRDDQRATGAEVAILASQALPNDIKRGGFDLREGIWVVDYEIAISVAVALRQGLLELASARQSAEGQQTKMSQVYEYLTGPRFQHRMSAVLERSKSMREELDRERRTLTRAWTRREEQIRGIEAATVGMCGDLEGIAGSRLNEVDGPDMLFLYDGVEGSEMQEPKGRALSAGVGV